MTRNSPDRAAAALAPGSTVGILGGGQLGRMIALAAARLGLKSHIFCPDPLSPAFEVTPRKTVAAYDDRSALEAFAAACDVVTYEFENIPADTASFLAERTLLRPGAGALAVAQDRLAEKTFVYDRGIATAEFRAVSDAAELAAALAGIGAPAVLKTRRLGYDGKGQARLERAGDADSAWQAVGGKPAILERMIGFEREVSLVMARGADGGLAFYDLVENRHENHILRTSMVPAGVSDACQEAARAIGERIAADLGYVGVLAIEFFVVVEDGGERLLVNEIAPRVHNSGHWTEAACPVSQFELHVRAICGWPLGATRRRFDVRMDNILGEEAADWLQLAGEPDAVLHLYGKAEARPGRKMGHITRSSVSRRVDSTG